MDAGCVSVARVCPVIGLVSEYGAVAGLVAYRAFCDSINPLTTCTPFDSAHSASARSPNLSCWEYDNFKARFCEIMILIRN